jgi:hypothetical protein
MGQPIMAFLQGEFGLRRRASALALAVMLVPLAAPVAFLAEKTFFEEFDFWAGTVALVVFGLIETILFAWVFGMEKGWREMHFGARLQVPRAFYYVIKYVTPTFILAILLGTVFQPQIGWGKVVETIRQGGELPAWEWSGDGLIGRLLHKDLDYEVEKLAAHKTSDWPEQKAFFESVRFWRTIDRLVLVLAFVAFMLLVAAAWKKRRGVRSMEKPA